MPRKFFIFFSLLSVGIFHGALSEAQDIDTLHKDTKAEKIFKMLIPEAQLAMGRMSFFGDVGYKRYSEPLKYRLATKISVTRPLLPYLSVALYGLSGKLYGNEKTKEENQNFQSALTVFGAEGTYNFRNFYDRSKPPPFLTPFVSAGFEFIHFKTYSDTRDDRGNSYYFWNDGTIKNLPEGPTGNPAAQTIQRDYSYETPVKAQSTIALPVGIGGSLRLSNKMSLKIGTIMHFTFSDNFDNVTGGGKDKFLYSSVGLHYSFVAPRHYYPDEIPFLNVDFKALDKEDSDGDNILNIKDECPDTPEGVLVDSKGCPLDDDNDGVPNYRDKEPNSKPGANVDELGIELTDEYIAQKLAEKEREDSIASAAPRQTIISSESSTGIVGYAQSAPPADVAATMAPDGTSYRVMLGRYKEKVPADLAAKFLNTENISSRRMSDGNTIYTSGSFSTKAEAEERKEVLISKGFNEAKVVMFDKDGNMKTGDVPPASPESTKSSDEIGDNDPLPPGEVSFKVQLGAFSQDIPDSVFAGISDIVTETSPKGLKRYLTGSFKSYQEAAAHKEQIIKMSTGDAFTSAFVVAYKGGKRVKPSRVTQPLDMSSTTQTTPVASQGKIKVSPVVIFKVQVGLFKEDMPADALRTHLTIKDLRQEPAGNGMIRHVSGSFPGYNEAKRHKDALVESGIQDAFIVAYKDGVLISVKEAVEITEQEK